jgi:hypothetical protein
MTTTNGRFSFKTSTLSKTLSLFSFQRPVGQRAFRRGTGNLPESPSCVKRKFVFLSVDWSAPKARPPSLWVTPLRRRRKILIAPLRVKAGGAFSSRIRPAQRKPLGYPHVRAFAEFAGFQARAPSRRRPRPPLRGTSRRRLRLRSGTGAHSGTARGSARPSHR